jgi:mannose-6-phosphate isomerase-like protein (cupin superfamily)
MVFGPFEGMLRAESLCGGVAWFPPRSHAPAHTHHDEEEVIYILEGAGKIYFDGVPEEVKRGDFVSIGRGTAHSIENMGGKELKVLYVFTPPVVQGSYDRARPR